MIAKQARAIEVLAMKATRWLFGHQTNNAPTRSHESSARRAANI
jgi:hypothetical protein